jgi:hypothetical protein
VVRSRRLDDEFPMTLRGAVIRRHDLPFDLDLDDVRRVDSLRIDYDFDRSGWVITQERTLLHVEEDGHCNIAGTGEWIEVAFIAEDAPIVETTKEAVEAQHVKNGATQ